jgi:hypothetical protein
MAAEFERQDFISDEALRAPLVMKKNWEEYLVTMQEVRKAGLDFSNAFKGAGSAGSGGISTKKLKDDTDKLAQAQKELTKVSNAMSIAIARDNDEYRKQEQALVKLKAEMKEKNALGEKEAVAVNKLNSSLKEIEAALNANRVAYSNLRSEEERNSKTGVTLLKTIQSQKEAASELREEMGQFSGNVGNYTASILKAHKAIQDQEKETKDLMIAQKGLDKSTDEGKKSFDDLKIAIQNNITQINVYRKEAGMAETSTDELNKQLEEGEKSTGGLGDALGKISPGLKAAYDGAVSFGKALWALVANPVGLILVAIAAAVAGLARYFTATSEGQDKWNKVLAVGEAILDTFLDILESVGKALVDMFTKPKETFEGFMKLIQPLTDKLSAMWEDPLQACEDFVKFLATNLWNRLTSIIVLAKAVGQAFSGEWQEAARTAANAAIQFATGVENGYDKIEKVVVDTWESALKKLMEYYGVAEDKAIKLMAIQERQNKFNKDAIQDIIDDSVTELEVSKEMAKVKDDLRFSEEDRLEALRKANKLLEEQSKGDVALAQTELDILKDRLTVLKDGLAVRQLTEDELKQIADLTAKVNNTEQEFLDGKKKRNAEEFATVQAIQKRRQDAINAERIATENLNKWKLEDSIATNEKIIANEFSNLGESTKAIADINEAKIQMTINASNKEMDEARKAARERVNLSSEVRDEIFNNTALSLDQQLALQEEHINKAIDNDVAYQTEAVKITEDMFAKMDELTAASTARAKENVFAVLARDAQNLANKAGTLVNTDLLNLEKQFADNEISLQAYNDKKLEIQQKGEQASLDSQLKYLEKQLTNAQEGSAKQIELQNQISAVKLQMQTNENALKIEGEQKVQEGLQELSTTGVDLAMETINNFFAAENEAREARLEKIQENMEEELAAAGDNETAKVAIKNKAAAEEQKVRMQQAAAMRKQAIFEKTVAVISIAINTAKGIGQALGTYPPPASFVLAAITAVLGALQIAAVVSKPIPSYAVGTKNHKGGLAQVGEEGSELITLPSGKSFLSPDESTVMALPARTKVDTHKETMNQLALASLPHEDRMGSRMDVEMLGVIGSKLDSLEKTVRNKKEQHWNISKQGMQAMVKNAETRQYFMDQLYR